MSKKKLREAENILLNKGWTIQTEMQINGRNVSEGTELKIRGVRGRFRFIKHVKTETTEWIDVWGGPKGAENWRSFPLDMVKTVHVKNTTVANLAKEYKKKLKDKKSELDSVDVPNVE
jgi:hypothetical protein